MGETKSVNNNNHINSPKTSFYEENKTRAKVDLAIKKIFFIVVVGLNLGAIASVYTFVTLYCPIKAEPLIATSFIVGVIGGLVSLKIPTFGVNNFNLNQYLSPATLLGRALAYAFFGPAILVRNQIDWTNYGNAQVANEISGDLKKDHCTFEYFAETYGSNLHNLVKYGFISKEGEKDVRSLYEQYIPLKMKKDYILFYAHKIIGGEEKKSDLSKLPADKLLSKLPADGSENGNNEHIVELRKTLQEIIKIEEQWKGYKKEEAGVLLYPSPKLDLPNFQKWHIRKLHQFYNFADKEFVEKANA